MSENKAVTMGEDKAVPKNQSFPSVDEGVAWIITVMCLVIGLLLTLGILSIQVDPLPALAWVGIVLAQIITAVTVAAASGFSSRRRAANKQDAEADTRKRGA